MSKTKSYNASDPAYLKLLQSDQLQDRVTRAYQHLEDCDLCALLPCQPQTNH